MGWLSFRFNFLCGSLGCTLQLPITDTHVFMSAQTVGLKKALVIIFPFFPPLLGEVSHLLLAAVLTPTIITAKQCGNYRAGHPQEEGVLHCLLKSVQHCTLCSSPELFSSPKVGFNALPFQAPVQTRNAWIVDWFQETSVLSICFGWYVAPRALPSLFFPLKGCFLN